MPYMVTIAHIMNLKFPWGQKNDIFAIRAAVSEIQLIITFRGRLALISTNQRY